MKQEFGTKLFKEKTNCNTYGLSGLIPGYLYGLLDHGFIADAACVWNKKLDGHELAIVSRTYCEDETIDNPPKGLKCIRLANVMGEDDPGTAIATVIIGATPASVDFLNACKEVPINMFPCLLSQEMAQKYSISLSLEDQIVKVGINKIKREWMI